MTEYILIVDLEATCWDGDIPGLDRKQTVEDMEIIEFGCVVATHAGDVVDERAFLVRPQIHPQLSSFCTELTSISQTDVDAAPYYCAAVSELNTWLRQHRIVAWGSWGDYDRRQIDAETNRHKCVPDFMELPHFNLKKRWRAGKTSNRRSGLALALAYHKMEFEGRHHRGIDDARNIARLLPFIEGLETAP